MPRTAAQMLVDGELTNALNQDNAVKKWMLATMKRFSEQLEGDPDSFFHIKGGTSLALYLNHYAVKTDTFIAQSDWDTQFVLNPKLEPSVWYARFTKIARILEDLLCEAQASFTKLAPPRELQKLATGVASKCSEVLKGSKLKPSKQRNSIASLACTTLHPLQYLDTAAAVLKGVPENEWGEKLEDYYEFMPGDFEQKCKNPAAGILLNHTIKDFYLFRLMVHFEADPMPLDVEPGAHRYRAELIDISIPRRDTMEAMQQWHTTKSRLFPTKFGLVVPDHFYHLDEQIQMVRENIAGSSASPHKRHKRLVRGVAICNLTKQHADLNDLKLRLIRLFPKCESIVKQNSPEARLHATMLYQYYVAYDLQYDADFRHIIDRWYFDTIPKTMRSTTGIKAFDAAMQGCHSLSAGVEAHLGDRSGAVIAKNWSFNNTLITALHTAVTVNSASGTKTGSGKACAQLGVAGDLAAFFHLRQGKRSEPCPVPMIELLVHFEELAHKKVAGIVRSALETFGRRKGDNFKLASNGDKLFLYWPKPEKLGKETYQFLYATVRLLKQSRQSWPPLAFINGVPVIAARPLLLQFEQRLARIEEFGVSQRLAKIVIGLRRLVTQYW